MKNTLLILLLIILSFSCSESSNDPVVYDIDNMPSEGYWMNHWQVLGPFTQSDLNKDNLAEFGFEEQPISLTDYKTIWKEGIHNEFVRINRSPVIDFNRLYTPEPYWLGMSGNVYCMAILKSSKEKLVKLNFSSDDGAKVWLNGELIYRVDRIKTIGNYENYLELPLNKGDNTLLIKVNNQVGGWQMFAVVEEPSDFREKFASCGFRKMYDDRFLIRNVFQDDTLRVNKDCLRKALEGGKVKVVIDKATQFLLTEKDTMGYLKLPDLNHGIHMVKLVASVDSIKQIFYNGDLIKDALALCESISKDKKNWNDSLSVDALLYRVNHLMIPKNKQPKDVFWLRKLLHLYSRLAKYEEVSESRKDSIALLRGFSLNAYRSKIDGGLNYYQIYAPQNYTKEKALPLFVIWPVVTRQYPNYLESERVANQDAMDNYQRMADRNDVLVMVPHCRTVQLNYNNIEDVEFWEAYEDVECKYNIDENRIYLNAYCASSRDLLKMAVKYPDRFAAIGFVSPSFPESYGENYWTQFQNPLLFLDNIRHLPIIDIHNKIDFHNPYEETLRFYEYARKAELENFNLMPIFVPDKYYAREQEVLDFCMNYNLRSSPEKVHFKTSQLKYNHSFWLTICDKEVGEIAEINAEIKDNVLKINTEHIQAYTIDLLRLPFDKREKLKVISNGDIVYNALAKENFLNIGNTEVKGRLHKTKELEGPVAHALTSDFMLVTGTIGKQNETELNISIRDSLNLQWSRKYYNPARSKIDKEVSEEDIALSNLVLIGSPQSNLILRKIYKQLPLKVTSDFVTIKNHKVEGDKLGYYLVYPNPLNIEKYVVVLGYNGDCLYDLSYENNLHDISAWGSYDYKVWHFVSGVTKSFGYFDKWWK